MTRRQTTVLIVDDHALVVDALRALLADQSDMDVVGTAGSVAESITKVVSLRPDIVLMDFRLPDGTGDSACASIKLARPLTKLIFVTREDSPETRQAARHAGANDFIHKSRAAYDLVGAIRRAVA